MVRRLLQLSGTPSPDAADALACAICHAHGSVGVGAAARRRRLDAPRTCRPMKARRPSTRPVAVIFDMDGLMLDTESLGPADVARSRGRHRRRLRSRPVACDDRAQLPRLPGNAARALRRRPIRSSSSPRRASPSSTPSSRAKASRRSPACASCSTGWKATNVARAVATSTRRDRAEAQLDAAGTAASASRLLVGGNEVERGKPAPDIFLLAASVSPSRAADCVVLEDSEPGVRAALAAGMMPIMVPDMHRPSPDLLAREPLVLPSLHDVRAHLALLPR